MCPRHAQVDDFSARPGAAALSTRRARGTFTLRTMNAFATLRYGETGRVTGTTAGRGELAEDNARALEAFLAGVERKAFRIAQIALRDADDALDAVQDAMLQLVRRYAARPEPEWKPLFYRILENRLRDQHRRRGVRNRVFAWLPGRGG